MTAEMFKADETACIVYNTTRKRVYVKQDRDRDVICFVILPKGMLELPASLFRDNRTTHELAKHVADMMTDQTVR